MTDIYRLGRIPSQPDARDYRLADYLRTASTDTQLRDQALTELYQTSVGFKNRFWTSPPANTHWHKALDLLAQIGGTVPPPPPIPSGDKEWTDSEPVLDQGNYGTCVGNGWAQWGNTLPIDDHYTEKDARAIYYETTVIDGAPDDPDAPGGGQQGATVRSGAKAMQNRSKLKTYAFAATTTDISAWLQGHGPLVFGSDWTNDMFNPDSKGFVRPTGGVAGGHCYLCLGDLPSEQAFLCLNSWGSSWGLNGYFKIKYTDYATLLASGGEAVAAVEV